MPPYAPDETLAIRPQLDAVATVTGIDEDALARRAVTIMRELARPESWSSEADDDLGRLLRSARVHLPYRRPRGDFARRALSRVVAELVDAGVLSDADLGRLGPILRIHDPRMVRLVPSARLDMLRSMPEPGHGSDAEIGWLAGVVAACDSWAGGVAAGSTVVVAERSEFRHVGRIRMSEKRRAVLGRAGAAPGAGGELTGVATVRGCPLDAYAAVAPRTRPTPLAVENSSAFIAYDTPSPDWLALNPVVGRDLGWRLVEGVLARWESADGTPMAWSEWWTDGTLQSTWPAPSGVVAEGWIVLVSTTAADDLEHRYGPLRYDVTMTRSLDGPGDRAPAERTHRHLAAFDRG